MGFEFSCWVQNGDTITVYIFGEFPKEGLVWTLYENGSCEKVIEGTVSPEISEMTFKDYALCDYDETSGILESDLVQCSGRISAAQFRNLGKRSSRSKREIFSPMRWHEYTPHTGAGADIENGDSAAVSRH